MGVLSSELSSWRKHLVECKAGIVNTLNFRDTRPNVMLVMNPSNAKVMSCLDSIPTEKNYDFMIKNHYARLVGRPTPTSQVYFLSDYDVTLQVYSIYDKNFDPSWLSDFSIDNVNIESESLQPILDALKAQSKTTITGVEDGVILSTHDDDILTQLTKFFENRSFNDLVSSRQIEGTTNIRNVLDTINDSYNKLTSNGSTNLQNLSQLLTLLTAGGSMSINEIAIPLNTLTAGSQKGITDIIGSDGTSLEDLKNKLEGLQGKNSIGKLYTIYDVYSILDFIRNVLLQCHTLLGDIKTNTTPTTTP